MNKFDLRKSMRAKRRALSPLEQKTAAQKLAKNLCSSADFLKAKHIALYLANDGEIDPSIVIKRCWQLNKKVYLPVLHPFKKGFMWFVEYTPKSVMQKNIYGISEPNPLYAKKLSAKFINFVGFPLVAFDKNGGRLGMGGGFYDRTFEFTRHEYSSITLTGFSHHVQQVDRIPAEEWDIHLNCIATDNFYLKIQKTPKHF